MEEQRKRQEFKLFVVGLPPLLSAQRNPYIIQGVSIRLLWGKYWISEVPEVFQS